LTVPDDIRKHHEYSKWVKEINIAETPSWSGLPNNVEKIIRQRQASQLISNIKLIQGTGDDLSQESGQDSGANWLG